MGVLDSLIPLLGNREKWPPLFLLIRWRGGTEHSSGPGLTRGPSCCLMSRCNCEEHA